jgi:hypothetical protein
MIIQIESKIADQLEELSQITQRPVEDVVNQILKPWLEQVLDTMDVNLLQGVIAGSYASRIDAVAAARSYNQMNRRAVARYGKRYVERASVAESADGFCIEFEESALATA